MKGTAVAQASIAVLIRCFGSQASIVDLYISISSFSLCFAGNFIPFASKVSMRNFHPQRPYLARTEPANHRTPSQLSDCYWLRSVSYFLTVDNTLSSCKPRGSHHPAVIFRNHRTLLRGPKSGSGISINASNGSICAVASSYIVFPSFASLRADTCDQGAISDPSMTSVTLMRMH